MGKWEYQLIPLASDRAPPQVEVPLNAAGEDGWEVATVYISGAGYKFSY
jgi:hypothetical protein